MQSIKDLSLKDKRVFLRVDFNVPFDKQGKIADNTRIIQALPTIKYLLDAGAKVVIATHVGRPEGKPVPELSTKPIAMELARQLKVPVGYIPESVGPTAANAKKMMLPATALMLENLRFDPREESNDETFAKGLASGIDVYVNDAFGTAHRKHASTYSMAKFVKNKAPGFLVEKELEFLLGKTTSPERPFSVILGGAKVSDKIKVIDALIDKCDQMFIGGAMAFTFMLALDKTVGSSLCEPDQVALAKRTLERAKQANTPIHLPLDYLVSDKVDFKNARIENINTTSDQNIPDNFQGVDIGPQTIDLFTKELQSSKTILWNGPMGIFEIEESAKGTQAIANAVANSIATTIIGGGDSVAAINQLDLASKVSFISTGGGASLKLLEGEDLPGLTILKQTVNS